MDIKDKTVEILKQYEIGSRFSYLPALPKASVLIPLFVRDGELHVLMTLRSLEVSITPTLSHSHSPSTTSDYFAIIFLFNILHCV